MKRKGTEPETKQLAVDVTYKQYEWVENLAEDLRSSSDDVIQNLIQDSIDAQASGDSASYVLRRVFRLMVRNQGEDRLRQASLLLRELEIMLEIAQKEEEARGLRLKLLAKHEQYYGEFGGEAPSMVEGE